MYYEINVSKKDEKGVYRHYFATAKRSITTKERLEEISSHFYLIFPKPYYKVSVYYVPEVSYGMEFEDFIKNPQELTDKK